ncbi:putative porin [Acinetobacter stercoris]|uniref:Porin n=1 Tax=Acinetobacter stercoris TaxID=2126983 RepID=A0A2U3MY71_9GAMM|nr:putative porin [Acinetobacter stercoris]SPL70377.1 hypothetical protein KPC_1555 [Acinetobacter stercoris]
MDILKNKPTQSTLSLLIKKSLCQTFSLFMLAMPFSVHAAETEAEVNAADAPLPVEKASHALTTPEREVRVIYLPESERKRIREEIKQEVLATAKKENWAQPSALPDWINRIKLYGDLRVRGEGNFYDKGNFPYYINYNAINTGSPYDTTGQSGLPSVINTTKDRERLRLRARLGLTADISETLKADFRLTTGGFTNPVSSNETMGNNFNRYNLGLDRAYLTYQPIESLSIWAGRMENPWYSSDLVWDDDLGFDGVAAKYQFELSDSVKPFITVGALSVQNTSVDLPTYSVSKQSSRDKWLFAGQIGTDWKIQDDINARVGLAYYHFYNVVGNLSSPCPAYQSNVPCSTDNTRPMFMQQGNTLFALRQLDISGKPEGPQYQYFGLATPYQVLNLNTQLDFTMGDEQHLIFNADYVNNVGFDEGRIRKAGPVTNSSKGYFDGGDQGYQIKALFGHPKAVETGQWNVSAGYRYLESDAVLDAFTDSDFHMGGTNAKGFFVGGNYSFTRNAWLGLRYLSADTITGAPYSVDVLQLDLNARF